MNKKKSDPLLKLEELSHQFVLGSGFLQKKRVVQAVSKINLEVHAGETLGIVGESGCGKSTLGRALLRLYQPTSGKILFEGRDITDLPKNEMAELRQQLQIIFQDPMESLNSRHTVGEILKEPFEIHKIGTKKERDVWVGGLLEKVGLSSESVKLYPHEFSGGQRQRIGIARAIALKPKLIVCDEAVSALDVSVQAQVINLLLDLQKDMNLALIFIAHDLSVVKHISDRIAVMYLGEFVEMGEAIKVYNEPLHPYTKALVSAIPVPDPRQKSKRISIEGDVPSPMNPPTGCYFHPRCPLADERCASVKPKYRELGKARFVACHKV